MATEIPDKLYFKIGEVAGLLQVKTHVLRYWETEFKTLQPVKSRSNQRLYRRKDVEIALLIKDLLYQQGFTIAGARKKVSAEMRAQNPDKSSQKTHQQILQAVKEDLLRIQQRLRNYSAEE